MTDKYDDITGMLRLDVDGYINRKNGDKMQFS